MILDFPLKACRVCTAAGELQPAPNIPLLFFYYLFFIKREGMIHTVKSESLVSLARRNSRELNDQKAQGTRNDRLTSHSLVLDH